MSDVIDPDGRLGSPTERAMARQFAATFASLRVIQAVFARETGVSAKHLNQVLKGRATARVAALDYWAYVLGYRWEVRLVRRED